MANLSETAAEIDKRLATERHMLVGKVSTGLTCPVSTNTYLTPEISLDANSYYTFEGAIIAAWGNAGDGFLKADISGITEDIWYCVGYSGFLSGGSIEIINLNITSATTQGAKFSGAFATGTSPTIRFKINPGSASVDVNQFFVNITKVTDAQS